MLIINTFRAKGVAQIADEHCMSLGVHSALQLDLIRESRLTQQ